jgi:hypothetical protein
MTTICHNSIPRLTIDNRTKIHTDQERGSGRGGVFKARMKTMLDSWSRFPGRIHHPTQVSKSYTMLTTASLERPVHSKQMECKLLYEVYQGLREGCTTLGRDGGFANWALPEDWYFCIVARRPCEIIVCEFQKEIFFVPGSIGVWESKEKNRGQLQLHVFSYDGCGSCCQTYLCCH